jgi:glucose-1-phosphate cytidylyltransferase
MKVVILAGGLGTRLSEETDSKPKPMVEIGGKPILWHIMKTYSSFGYNEFIICCGYKGYVIKEYFTNYFLHQSDLTIEMKTNKIEIHNSFTEPWKITMVDTGLNTMTGGRLKKIQQYVAGETFMMTYGDGISNVNINKLVDFHKNHGKLATLTAVQPTGRFGALKIDNQQHVSSFQEKPKGDGSWINGGFFVLESKIFDYIKDGDATIWEQAPLSSLANDLQIKAYYHEDFWRPVDTLRDKLDLNEIWNNENCPWKLWK